MVPLGGVTEIEEIVAFVTVKFADVLSDPRVAVIMVVPEPKPPRGCPIAMPLLETVATVVSEEDQVTWRVRLRVPPSLKVPVAVS
jgi:hypothetical protein